MAKKSNLVKKVIAPVLIAGSLAIPQSVKASGIDGNRFFVGVNLYFNGKVKAEVGYEKYHVSESNKVTAYSVSVGETFGDNSWAPSVGVEGKYGTRDYQGTLGLGYDFAERSYNVPVGFGHRNVKLEKDLRTGFNLDGMSVKLNSMKEYPKYENTTSTTTDTNSSGGGSSLPTI
jgi:hypothetical protein